MKRLVARAAVAALAAWPLALFATGTASATPVVTLLDGVTFTINASGNTVTPTITNTTGADVYCFVLGQKPTDDPTTDQPDFKMGYPYGYTAVWSESTFQTDFLNVPDGDYLVYASCVNDAPVDSNQIVLMWGDAFASGRVQAVPLAVPGETSCVGLECGFGS